MMPIWKWKAGTEDQVTRQSSRTRPACIRVGFGQGTPKISVVGLYCDFGDSHLASAGLANVAQLIRVIPEDAELILVLNDPSPRFLQKTKEWDGRLITISTSANLGCVAKNLGYVVAQGEYIFSIDHDVFVRDRRAFDKCTEFLDLHHETALLGPCGGNLLEEHWSVNKWGVGGYYENKHIFGYDDPKFFGAHEDLDGTPVDTIPSMFWCFRRRLLSEIGPLDWRLGPFVGSDSDFCFRAKERGHAIRIMRVPIDHLDGGACSHKKQTDLQAILEDHLRVLYERWHAKRHIICENYKNETATSPSVRAT